MIYNAEIDSPDKMQRGMTLISAQECKDCTQYVLWCEIVHDFGELQL